jgi:hypothetical protein
MNVDKMKAGKETDARVAERIVGVSLLDREAMLRYCRKRIGRDNTTIVSGPDGTDIAYSTDSRGRFTPTSPRQIFKHYSTDIAASFEVDKPEWQWTFKEDPTRLIVLLWHKDVHPFLDKQPLAVANIEWDEVGTKAEAYALGRCRAALKVVEKLDS